MFRYVGLIGFLIFPLYGYLIYFYQKYQIESPYDDSFKIYFYQMLIFLVITKTRHFLQLKKGKGFKTEANS